MAATEFSPAGSGGLKSLEIISGDEKINLIPLLESIQINESLMSPSFNCVIYIVDALDIINSLPIVGEEQINVTLNSSGVGIRSYKFQITSVDNVVSTVGSTTSRYKLQCITLEDIENALVSVDKYLNDMISLSALNVYEDTLQSVDNTIFNYHPTGNRADYLVNGLLPFETMKHLCGRAYSETSASSYYAFYRNKDGFNFHNIEQLIKDGRDNPIATYNYDESIRTSLASVTKKWEKEFYNIKNYVIDSRSNIGDRIYNGGLSSSVEEVDIISKQITYHNYIAHAHFNDINEYATDKTAVNPNSDSFLEKHAYKINERSTYITDVTRFDQYAKSIIPRRLSYSLLTQNLKMNVKVPGNVDLSVGKVISLNLPTVHGFTIPKLNDNLISGNWLITDVDHITDGQEFDTSFYCVKIGFKKGLNNEKHYKKQ